MQTLAKRAHKIKDTRLVGRRTCAQTTSMDQSQPSQQNHHSDELDITMSDDFDNLIDDVPMPPNNFADRNEPPVPDNHPCIPPDD
ncbi:uncharacterized protein F5891DRAFT_1196818 [Suillus fuscotomentosus]|uniref:Uncharacterized protein n=1 Tax=Suillus fuscotomentosus TaxID=1912939 RepID=A0AAD4HED2_9AGAM|nr:uncharacterized protein F5891DRAFT_1196818 [Suillus fuscotomentosus]KAG1893096.1 hypothetical protein F5891DRAFT_1196818 [Suillus fuscotomentosus]